MSKKNLSLDILKNLVRKSFKDAKDRMLHILKTIGMIKDSREMS